MNQKRNLRSEMRTTNYQIGKGVDHESRFTVTPDDYRDYTPHISDEDLRGELEQRLSEHIDMEHVKIRVTDGIVTLDGIVPDEIQRSAALATAAQVAGVEAVYNQLNISA